MRFTIGLILTASVGVLLRADDAKPNIVLIMADDLGYECLGVNGGDYKTPRLDQLATTGIRFTDCHVQPLCTPTRVQLMTGRWNVHNYIKFGLLPKTETTFGQLLQQAGYTTGICGKWQLGQEKKLPQSFGFEESYLWQHTRRPPRYANPGLEHNGKPIDFDDGQYGPTLVNDFARDFIKRNKAKPFFLYYPMILTHNPFQPTPDSPDWDPKAHGEKVHQASQHFAEMTTYMDKMVGQIIDTLETEGIRENTLLIFVGDNGTSRSITSRFQGETYLGGKGTTTARGTHVPLIIDWPAVMKSASVDSELVASVDLFATVCDAAGVPQPKLCDGVSLVPRLKGKVGPRRETIYCWYSPRQKADFSVEEFAFNRRAKLYRDGRFFDLKADPFEKQAIDPKQANGPLTEDYKLLQKKLDELANARPKKLDTAFNAPQK